LNDPQGSNANCGDKTVINGHAGRSLTGTGC